MNFRSKAASFVLCNEDIDKAIQLLDSSDTIPDEVVVHIPFVHESRRQIIEYINQLENMLNEAYKQGKKS